MKQTLLRASGAGRAEREASAYTQSPAGAAERPHAVVPTDRGRTEPEDVTESRSGRLDLFLSVHVTV